MKENLYCEDVRQKKEQTKCIKARPTENPQFIFSSTCGLYIRRKSLYKGLTILIVVVVVKVITRDVQFPPAQYKSSFYSGNVQDAEKALHKANLNIDESNISYELTEDIEQGIVISSSPEEGSEVGGDTSISLVVSSGIGVTCDDFVGQNITDVKKQLNSQYPNLTVNAVSRRFYENWWNNSSPGKAAGRNVI